METNNKYVVEIFIPTEFSSTIESGITRKIICEKVDEKYVELESKKEYIVNNQMGTIKIFSVIPLSEYYYKIGLKRKNIYKDKNDVHKLVKTLRKSKKI